MSQASDLRRLLEMYKRWQQRFFPQHGFDEALDNIAQLGRSSRIRVLPDASTSTDPLTSFCQLFLCEYGEMCYASWLCGCCTALWPST